jgi:hypothetical protein
LTRLPRKERRGGRKHPGRPKMTAIGLRLTIIDRSWKAEGLPRALESPPCP